MLEDTRHQKEIKAGMAAFQGKTLTVVAVVAQELLE
jgi:hypothetical protein